jgi:hypothetical protein
LAPTMVLSHPGRPTCNAKNVLQCWGWRARPSTTCSPRQGTSSGSRPDVRSTLHELWPDSAKAPPQAMVAGTGPALRLPHVRGRAGASHSCKAAQHSCNTLLSTRAQILPKVVGARSLPSALSEGRLAELHLNLTCCAMCYCCKGARLLASLCAPWQNGELMELRCVRQLVWE